MESHVLPVQGSTALELMLLGGVVGALAGLFGVGGGFLLTPVLSVAFRIPYELAVGSTLTQMAVTSAVGAWRHVRNGRVDARLGALLVVGGFLGTEAGVRLQHQLRALPELHVAGRSVPGFDVAMSSLFIALLVAIGSWMWVETGRARRRGAEVASLLEEGSEAAMEAWRIRNDEPVASPISQWLANLRLRPLLALASDPERRLSVWVPLGLGAGTGMLTGILGTGGGFLMMPALIYVLGLPTLFAVGTSSLLTAVTALYGSARYVASGEYIAAVVAAILAGSVAGVWLGARFADRLPRHRLRRAFAAVVLGTGVMLALDLALLLAG